MLLSIKKYSCSGPTDDTTRFASVTPNNRNMRSAWWLRACMERKSGVFLSRASPLYEQKAVGIYRVLPLIKA
jgi:hypothetical protein